MPIEGDVYAIAKVLREGSNVHEDSREVGEMLKTALIVAVSHPGTGRVYTTNFFTRNRKAIPYGTRSPHQASAPGEPPAPDTMELMNSIDYSMARVRDGTEVDVGSTKDHSVYTEFGTQNMEPRPWFRSTIDKFKDRAFTIWAKGIERRERAKARQLGGSG